MVLFLVQVTTNTMTDVENSHCVFVDSENDTVLGRVFLEKQLP